MSPYGLPAAGSVGSHSPEMSHPSGCLCSLPRNRPVAWFPASARWHVFSAALRLPPSLPLMSPYGLPAAGYPASARWHVFKFPVSNFQSPLPPSALSASPREHSFHSPVCLLRSRSCRPTGCLRDSPERLPKPPGSREVLFLFPLILNPKHINPRTFTAIFFQKKD
jgi:hypothetical protein